MTCAPVRYIKKYSICWRINRWLSKWHSSREISFL